MLAMQVATLAIVTFLLGGISVVQAHAQDEEITLRGSAGTCTAYIANDNDSTIYLWTGEPVAYLNGKSIYGFNGKHLGWFVKGIVQNHDGDAVGAVTARFVGAQSFCPFKSFKQFKPFKSFTEFEPFMPFFHLTWSSDETLKVFLKQGASN